MFISLKHTLYTDLSASVSSLSTIVQAKDQRLLHVETKMSDLYTAHSELIDVYTEHDDELHLIKLKLADLEDRSHWSNIKFRNIPETIQQPDMVQYLQALMRSIVPDLTDRDLEIERGHRLSISPS